MFRTIIVICCVFAVSNATNVKRCNKGRPFPLSVDIEGCTEPPCDVVKGTAAVMKVHFVNTKDNMKKITAQVRATAFGITVPYKLPEDVADVCSNLLYGASCPIDKSEDVVYNFKFMIEKYYPEIKVKVEISLVDEDNKSVACFTVDIRVKKGSA